MDNAAQAMTAMIYGLLAGPGFAAAIGTYRKGLRYGLVCGFLTVLLMAAILFPLYLGFAGSRFRLS